MGRTLAKLCSNEVAACYVVYRRLCGTDHVIRPEVGSNPNYRPSFKSPNLRLTAADHWIGDNIDCNRGIPTGEAWEALRKKARPERLEMLDNRWWEQDGVPWWRPRK